MRAHSTAPHRKSMIVITAVSPDIGCMISVGVCCKIIPLVRADPHCLLRFLPQEWSCALYSSGQPVFGENSVKLQTEC